MYHHLLTPLCALVLFCCGLARADAGAGEKLLFVGNSITLHGPAPKIGWTGNWGMAASALEKDYVHLVVDAVGKQSGKQPEFQVVNVAEFERKPEDYDLGSKLKDPLAFQADTVIVAIGENVPGLKTEDARAKFKANVERLLALLKRGGKSTVFVRSCFWADAAKDSVLKAACEAAGGIFIDIGTLSKDPANFASSERKIEHAGVARHPGDQGMKAIADAISAAIKKAGK